MSLRGVRFLAAEYFTVKTYGGRIDSLELGRKLSHETGQTWRRILGHERIAGPMGAGLLKDGAPAKEKSRNGRGLPHPSACREA
ncbi:MAG: hypothetical protein ACK4KV_14355 [Rhodocyclaceae bacterium]